MIDEKEREICIGENRFYLSDNNMLYITIVGDVDKETAIACKNATDKLYEMIEGKVHILIDINKAGKQSSEARKIGVEKFDDRKVGKVALFGLHPVARVLASFVMNVSKNKNMRFFKTTEEAIAWIREE